MRRKYRIINWNKVASRSVIVLILILFIGVYFGYHGWQKCHLEKQLLETQLNSYAHMVYVAAENLPEGTILTSEKVNLERRYFNLDHMNLITKEAFGKIVSIDVAEGTCITAEMLYQEKKNGKEIFLSDIEYRDYLQAGDRIDVRIRYKNAEDYTVLTDKIVKICDSGNGIVLEMTEEEILLMSSAYTDRKKYEGTGLYVARYPEDADVSTGSVNYIPNKEILSLLGREKTEGESRCALETRLMQ